MPLIRFARAFLVLVLVCPWGSLAATTFSYANPTVATLSLSPFASLPLQLTQGPDGATIGPTSTSTSATISGRGSGVSANNTILTNPNAWAVQARLVYKSGTGPLTNCNPCKMQLVVGTVTMDEITVDNAGAPAAGTAGPWVTVSASGQSGNPASLWSYARSSGHNTDATIVYWLEIKPAGLTSPIANYTNMTQTFTV
ncbi:MAG: hypothetical protein WDA16_10375 [Candidatus Thermoplasmatota archaeon]